jgi:predicted flap endonuclease-1-like 5' DNA nuclease
MIWLVIEMWVLLLAAFLLGAIGAVWAMSARKRSAAASGAAAEDIANVRATAPTLLFDAPDGQKDDLTLIIGIDRDTESRLNNLGVFHLRQIATWDDGAARWIEIRLNEPGRVARERWTEQATAIA